MIRLIAAAGLALFLVTPSHGAVFASLPQSGSMVTNVVAACGAGRTRVNGVCVARTTVRQTRRCARWSGGTCLRYY